MDFSKLSYLAQVYHLRRMADLAIAEFPLRLASLKLINHGENATFAIIDTRGRKFVLRIHRPGYHTDAGIRDELKFLQYLAQHSALEVQHPQVSRTGKTLIQITLDGDTRRCSLLSWQDGRFVDKIIKPHHMRLMGETLGQLHLATRKLKLPNRARLDTEALVGRTTTFGPIDRLTGVSALHQKIINEARGKFYRRIKAYERAHPSEFGPVHGDMHFGNTIFRNGQAIPIDFDDSGTSFRMQDLAVVVYASAWTLERGPKNTRYACWQELLEGYAKFQNFGEADKNILPTLGYARHITLLAWVHARQDHPQLRKLFPKMVRRKVKLLAAIDAKIDPKNFYGS